MKLQQLAESTFNALQGFIEQFCAKNKDCSKEALQKAVSEKFGQQYKGVVNDLHYQLIGKSAASKRSVTEGIEDTQSDLVDEFAQCVQKVTDPAKRKRLQSWFNASKRKFRRGYETDNDDMMDDGIEGMRQAIKDC